MLPPRTPEQGYHLSEDLAERAIQYLGEIRSVEPDQPFFLYFATGACHSPHHAPPEWIERYRGQFDGGWDAWRDATFARQQEMGLLPEGTRALAPPAVGARVGRTSSPRTRRSRRGSWSASPASSSHADAQIGQVLAFIEELGERDNTIVVLVSDNGASAEGGERGSINDSRLWNGNPAGRRELRERIDELGTQTAHNNYPWGWTMAGNTPFRRWKREVHEGGVADPCIVHWPNGIAGRGEIRHQFAHAIDVLPTILDLIGIDAPDRARRRRAEPDRRLELRGDAARRRRARAPHDAVLRDARQPRDLPRRLEGGDVQAARPDVRRRPRSRRAVRGRRVGAVPRRRGLLGVPRPRRRRSRSGSPSSSTSGGRKRASTRCSRSTTGRSPRCSRPRRPFDQRDRYVFWPNGAPIPENVTVNVRNRNHTITATVDLPEVGDRRRACCSRWGRCSAAGRSTCSTAGCGTCTTTSARSATR